MGSTTIKTAPSLHIHIKSEQLDMINISGAMTKHRNNTKLYLVQFSIGVFP